MPHVETIPRDPTPIIVETEVAGMPAAASVSAERLKRAVDRVNAEVREITGRILGAAEHIDELHYGSGVSTMTVDHPPIRELRQVRLRGVVVWDAATNANDQFGVARADLGSIFARCGWFGRAGVERPQFFEGATLQPWAIDYAGGFESIPADLRSAAIEWAAAILAGEDNAGVQSETIGNYSYTAASGSAVTDSSYMRVIRRYRLRTIGGSR